MVFFRVKRLDKAILPRGWFLSLLQQVKAKYGETLLVDKLFESMKDILMDLINGGDAARKYKRLDESVASRPFPRLSDL